MTQLSYDTSRTVERQCRSVVYSQRVSFAHLYAHECRQPPRGSAMQPCLTCAAAMNRSAILLMDLSLIEIIPSALVARLTLCTARWPPTRRARVADGPACLSVATPLQLYIVVGLQARHTPLRSAHRPIERNLIRSARLYLSTPFGGVCAAGGVSCIASGKERPQPAPRPTQPGTPSSLCLVGHCHRRAKEDARHLQQTLIQLSVVYRKLVCMRGFGCMSKRTSAAAAAVDEDKRWGWRWR